MPPRGAYKKSPGQEATTASGEVVLCAAVLRRAVDDARGQNLQTDLNTEALQDAAIAFLLDRTTVGFWIELAGGAVEAVWPQLLREAGLEVIPHE